MGGINGANNSARLELLHVNQLQSRLDRATKKHHDSIARNKALQDEAAELQYALPFS